MQVHVLYDADGSIASLSGTRKEPEHQGHSAYHPGPGQSIATLDVPGDLEQLRLTELHARLKVVTVDGSPRLTTRA
ncbi:hypothetical protein [Streptomyces sp. ICBB 8177]|uniref:hypothetical protein n=1 Tax=Streptomyces sp. ICBB 8177 TaxID=563922 RepID=UPI000D6831F9|nr:hypothetical protein [Streptomyces sp. ICBB 8177]PWI45052.1 hypothetical protein CK485_07740 [Streptomyces sp. ICBB 8177]